MYHPTPCIISTGQTVLNLGHTLQLASIWASSGKNQGKLRTNQPQLTPAHSSSGLRTKKKKFHVPRFVADNQAVKILCLASDRHRSHTR